MSSQIRLANDTTLPVDLVTQTLLVVGKRGSGKSNTCRRLAEQFFHAGAQFVAIDPTDTWFGLKSSRDGKAPGLGVYVFGGRHQDLPLESTGGALAADVIIDHGISAVLSIKHFSGRERSRFVSDFADRLFRRNSTPLHVFLEEAHEVAPQSPFKGEEEMLGRVTRIWKLGRSSGLGGSAITQRPASLSKNITTQAEILIVHRTLGPQDVAAVKEWIKYHGEHDAILSQLATLKTGEAFIWAPDFPEDKPIGLRRIQVLPSETFDSAATPKAGQKRAEPKQLAPVDLQKLHTAMAATIEKAKADDPKALRQTVAARDKRIAELERELKAAKAAAPAAETVHTREPYVPDNLAKVVLAVHERAVALRDLSTMLDDSDEILKECQRMREEIGKPLPTAEEVRGILTRPSPSAKPGYNITAPGARIAGKNLTPKTPSTGTNGTAVSLPAGERTVLIAIAQHGSVARTQLSILTGYKRSTRDAYIQRLREKGLVEIAGDEIEPTQDGVAALGPDFEPLPTGDALREHWLGKLPGGEREILTVIADQHPGTISRESLSERCGYARSSRDAYIQRLQARRLVVPVGRGEVKAAEELFD